MTGTTFKTDGVSPIGYTGIILSNVPGFAIGTTNPASSPNNFKDLINGIVANKSTFSVHRANFDIYGNTSPIESQGNAIFIENMSDLTATDNRFYTLVREDLCI